VTYVITFENLGPTGAVDARVRAVVNPALPLGTVTTTRGTVTVQGNFIDVFLGSFADEPPGEIRIPIPNAPAGTIEVRAEALTFNFDASEGNNAAAARADVLNQISTTQFAVTSVTVSEDAGTLELLVTRSGDTSVDSSVGFFDIPGTALPGVDYVMPANTTLIFPVSSTEQMISIQIIDRMLVQGIRAFDVQLEDPVNTQLGPQSTIRITILESDQLPETNFASPEFVVDEDAGVARLLVRRVGDISQASSVAFVDIPGTALPGVNYIMPTGRLNFAPGQDMNSIDVTIIDNFIQQDVLIFEVMLTDPIGTNIEVDQTRVLIENDDSTIVTNTNDAGRGSLRRAMLVSNATPGLDTIIFEIPSPQGEVQTITPLGPLPVITDPVILNGLSQPGALPPNLGGSSSGGVGLLATAGPLIELSGANLSAGSGLVLAVGNSIIQGLVINRFPEFGIFVTGGAGNTLRANMIGTDPTGTDGRPNREGGIEVTGEGGASTFNLLIASSLISGNGGAGVVLSEGSAASRLEGNFIGTTTSGLARVPNEFHGVVIANSSGNVIGGATPAARNLIGGNGFDPSRNQGVGVYIYNDLREGSGPLLDLAHDNLVIGNWIGLAADGTSGIPGSFVGIVIRNAAGNTIGGETPGAGNVISANFGSGVVLYETEAFRNSPGSGNIVAGNVIGLDATGLQPVLRSPSGESLRRQSAGILIQDSSFNRIGGASPGARNVIAGNGGPGVEIFDDVRTAGTPPATGNVILGNAIGVNRDGEGNDGRNPSVPGFIGNTGDGVFISAASGNTIGGSSTTDQNIIAGNALAGIRLLGRPALGNTIATNLLGQTITGGQTVPLPNGRGDIVLQNTGAASTSALARRLPRLPRRPKIKLIRTAPRAIAAIPRARLRLAQGLPTRPAAKP
jgi:hypothetical protein